MSKERSILIIEDSNVQRAVMLNLVKELGFRAFSVEKFDDEIFNLIKEEQISIVLLDLMLLSEDGSPIIDGFQLCNEIKDHNPNTKVVIVSAQSDEDAREFAMLQGADGFLAKPFKINDLERCVSAL
jgi:DNA-binding response OmpR family regulator